MNETRISVIDVAARLGTRKQQVFKILRRLGIKSEKHRSPEKHGQVIAYISQDEFRAVKAEFDNAGADNTKPSEPELVNWGHFYLIQLEPEQDPGRFKVGYATNMAERMRAHRCSAPFAEVVKTWPCRLLWEKTAIDCVTSSCEQLHTEVFRAEHLEPVIELCDAFFELMPRLEESK